VWILTRSLTAELASLPACIEAVEAAFRHHGSGSESLGLARIHLAGLDGGVFHMTAGGYSAGEGVGAVGVKLNGRFPPTGPGRGQRVSGAILLSDAATGKPIALLDSMVVTSLRTAAITALVNRLFARPGATTALIIGAGKQARGQLDALRASSGITSVAVFDIDQASAESVVAHARTLDFEATVVSDPGSAARTSDVIVTVTPARAPILYAADVGPGSLVIALGADAPGKQELDPHLLVRARVVVDLLDQAAESGELQHALAAGLLTRNDVDAELAEIVVGARPGRLSDDEIFVFDGTGTALQDVAAAATLVDEARRRGVGLEIDLEA
jgi:alanine dehydrogenase